MTKTQTWTAVGTIGQCTCSHRSADAAARCASNVGRLVSVVSTSGQRLAITVSESHTGRLVRCAGKAV